MYDLLLKKAKVIEILEERDNINFLIVELENKEKCKAVNYSRITGTVNINDILIVNTTALELSLGTGGYHYVHLNLSNIDNSYKLDDFRENKGHIMKMRYTPMQIRTLCAEEKASPYHDTINNFKSLDNLPVITLPLHSHLAPLLITYKSFFPNKKVVYIMSEGGSQALEFSNLIRKLKSLDCIDKTITYANCFGGDYETINIFTALILAKEVEEADLIVVAMGPGIVGASSKYGFSGVENVFIDKAVRTLGGRSIFVPRISFADERKRHYGISHHSITILKDLISETVELAFPENEYIKKQLDKNKLIAKHKISFYPIEEIEDILIDSQFSFNSMGRKFADDPLFFITAGLAVFLLKEDIKT
ncbi:DUF3866 family protein [Natronospora cellulosivora (SeqCode)]